MSGLKADMKTAKTDLANLDGEVSALQREILDYAGQLAQGFGQITHRLEARGVI